MVFAVCVCMLLSEYVCNISCFACNTCYICVYITGGVSVAVITGRVYTVYTSIIAVMSRGSETLSAFLCV